MADESEVPLPTAAVMGAAQIVPPAGADQARFALAIGAIDAANEADPNELVVEGHRFPKELAHGRLATAWVQHLDPGATEEQLLAARAHHLRRWTTPRDSYPRDRGGYLRWRAARKKQHAREVGQLLREAGYDEVVAERVGQIVRKEGLGGERGDPQVQTHEDALCLVFVQTQLQWLTAELGDEHMIAVAQKTLKKMSSRAIEAVGSLPLDDVTQRILAAAAPVGTERDH